jgi:hypothetical protein
MSDQTVHDVMKEALRLSTRLEAVTDETYRVARKLAEASHEHEQATAITWQAVRFEMGPRDDHGEKRLSRDYEEEVRARTADTAKTVGALKSEDHALDAASRNLRSQLSACQSVAAALREEMRLAGGPS